MPQGPGTPAEGLPYPVDEGGTHWDGCWRERGHHNCAVAEIERLRASGAPAGSAPEPSAEALRVLDKMREGYLNLVEFGIIPPQHHADSLALADDAGRALRGAAPTASAAAPEHVCGLSGYNPMIDPPCPGCQARHASAAAAEPSPR